MSEQQQQVQAEGPRICETCAKRNFKAEIGFHKVGVLPNGKIQWFIYDWGTNNEHKHVSTCKYCQQNIRWAQENGRNVPKELDGSDHRPNCNSQQQPTAQAPTVQDLQKLTQEGGTISANTQGVTSTLTSVAAAQQADAEKTNPIQAKVEGGNPARYSQAETEILTQLKRVEQLIIGSSPESMASKFSALTDGVNAWINSVENWMQDIQKKTVSNPFTAASQLDKKQEPSSRELEPETKRIFDELEREGRETANLGSAIYKEREVAKGGTTNNEDSAPDNVSN